MLSTWVSTFVVLGDTGRRYFSAKHDLIVSFGTKSTVCIGVYTLLYTVVSISSFIRGLRNVR